MVGRASGEARQWRGVGKVGLALRRYLLQFSGVSFVCSACVAR